MNLRKLNPSLKAILLISAASLLGAGPVSAQENAPETREEVEVGPQRDLIDVTRPPYHADPTGEQDSTAALQQAFSDARRRFADEPRGRVVAVFLPAGTYLVSDTLSFGGGIPRNMGIVGEGPERSVIRLADNAPGFAGSEPKAVVDFIGGRGHDFVSNVSFANVASDFAIEIGPGNPGAVGIAYHNNNTGYIRNMALRSLDPEGKGHTGLWIPGWLSGIAYFNNITIEGFDRAFYARGHKIMYVLEDIRLRNQRVAGIVSHGKPLAIRRLTSRNRVPAVVVEKADTHGQVVIVDSELHGMGESAAIVNAGQLFVRNVSVHGDTGAIDDRHAGRWVPAGRIDEYLSHDALTLGADTPARSLNLPIKDVPVVEREPREAWVTVNGADHRDATREVQAAIDSGAKTVLLNGPVVISDTIVLRGNVRHLIGSKRTPGGIGHMGGGDGLHPSGEAVGRTRPMLRIETGAHDVTVI